MSKEVTIMLSNRRMTRFMQDADLFENFKIIIMPLIKAKVIKSFGKKNIEALKRECDDSPYGLVAIYDDKKIYYRDENVKVISDGEGWCLLDDFINGKASYHAI